MKTSISQEMTNPEICGRMHIRIRNVELILDGPIDWIEIKSEDLLKRINGLRTNIQEKP